MGMGSGIPVEIFMKKKPMTETEEFNYLWSKANVWKSGWLDAKNGKDSAWETPSPASRSYDCLKARYMEGFAAGTAYLADIS